jgi:hypothetical protein
MFACKVLLLLLACAAAVADDTVEGNTLAVSVEIRNSSQIAAAKASSTTVRPRTTTTTTSTASAPTAAARAKCTYVDVTEHIVLLTGMVCFFQLVIWLCTLSSRVGTILGAGGKCGDLCAVVLPHDLFTWEVRSIAAKAKSRKRARDDDKVKEDFTYGQLRRREGDGDTETVDTIL